MDLLPMLMPKRGRWSDKAGLPPGTLIHTGKPIEEKVRWTTIQYNTSTLSQAKPADVKEIAPIPPDQICWINLDGLHDIAQIEAIGKRFGLHPLLLEDVVNAHQRPKVEEYDGVLFVVAKMLTWDEQADSVAHEQVSFVLGNGWLITFQERPGDVFGIIRKRLAGDKGRIRRMKADYLLYALLDAIVDYYFVVLERLSDRLEVLEEEVSCSTPDTLDQIRRARRDLAGFRRVAWPTREGIAALQRIEPPLVGKDVAVYLRDLYDHAVQIIDACETQRETVSSLMDLYLSSLSNRMNDIMKVLTIMASIFIPLTFLAGIYGMNFDHMPELHWRYSYPVLLALMAAAGLGMFAWFKRKGWL